MVQADEEGDNRSPIARGDPYNVIARHAGLVAVIALYLVIAVAYAWRIPIMEGADELGHALYVDHIVRERALPAIGTSWEAVQPPLYYLVAGSVVAAAGGPRLVPETLQENSAFSWENLVVANVMDPASYSPAEARPSRRLRLLSTLFGVFTLLLIHATALQVSGGRRHLALGATALPALTPQFAHHHAVITNDSLSTLWCALVTLQLIKALSGRRLRSAVSSPAAIGVVVGLGILTKYSMVPVGAVVFASLLLMPGDALSRIRRTAVFAAAALAICGVWLALNTYRYGGPLANVAMRDAHSALAVDGSMLDLAFEGAFLLKVFKSYWGMLGSMTVPLHVAAYAALALFTIVGVLGVPLALRRSAVPRRSAAALGAIFATTWVAFLAHNAHLSAAQGRLLYGALAAISVLLVVGWAAVLNVAVVWAGRDRSGLPPTAVEFLPIAALVAGLFALNIHTLAGPVQTAFHSTPSAVRPSEPPPLALAVQSSSECHPCGPFAVSDLAYPTPTPGP